MPVGQVSTVTGKVTVIRADGKGTRVNCARNVSIYSGDTLIGAKGAAVTISQTNHIPLPFKFQSQGQRFTVRRTESEGEKSIEREIGTYGVAMTRPRGHRITDDAALPASRFDANIERPLAVTVSQAGLGNREFRLQKLADGRYSDPTLEAWLSRARRPDEEVEFTLSRKTAYGSSQESFKILSAGEERSLDAELAGAKSSDPFDRRLKRALIFARHGLFTLARLEKPAP